MPEDGEQDAFAPESPLADPPQAEINPTGPLGTPFLELEGVTKSYGNQTALGPLTLRVAGGCTAVLGPNGAGKSTLMRILMGLTQPQSGTVKVLGETVQTGARQARRRIGYAPEGETIFPGLTGVESVAYAGRLSGMPNAAAIERSHQVLDYVGLAEERYRQAATYSAGMRQRLKLAQALVHDPQSLILDEPTEAVDPESRTHLLALVRDLSENHGLPILLSTHLLADVEQVAQSAIVLSRGQLVAQGPLAQLQKASKAGFIVRIEGNTRMFMNRLAQLGARCDLQHGRIHVQGAAPAVILQEAVAAGVTVRHLTPHQLTLHDAFRQAVGGAPLG